MIRVGFIGLGHNGLEHIAAHQAIASAWRESARRAGSGERQVGEGSAGAAADLSAGVPGGVSAAAPGGAGGEVVSEVTALCDRNAKRLSEAADRFGVERTYRSAEELCSDKNIDAVSIHTGDPYHVEPFVSALAHGKHVFVEKPLANSVEQVERMVDAARQADPGLRIAVGYVLRFNPVYQALHELIHAGRIGRPYYLEADYIHNLLYQARQTDELTGVNWYLRHERPIVGGGSHALDLLRWLSGAEVLEAQGYSTHQAFPEMTEDDCQVGLFRFDNGAVAKVAALYGPRRDIAPYNNLRIYGTMGTVEGDQVAIAENEEEVHPLFHPVAADRTAGHPYEPEIEDWLESIALGRPPRCDLFDGANSTVAALLAAEAAASGRVLRVPVYRRAAAQSSHS